MTEYDSAVWLLVRGPITIAATVVLVIFLLLTIPNVDNPAMRADLAAARVAYAGGFLNDQGSVDAAQFAALEGVHQEVMLSDSGTIDVPVGVAATLQSIGLAKPLRVTAQSIEQVDESEATVIIYNDWAFRSYQPFVDAENPPRGMNRRLYQFPTAVEFEDGTTQGAVLQLEVLYAD